MTAQHTPRAGTHALLLAFVSCLLAWPLFAEQKDYQEAHVFITAPGVPPATAPVSPAVEVVRPMLLSDRGFQTVEPLEQPDEHVPTIIIRMTPRERWAVARRLKDRVYGRTAEDVRACHKTG